MQYVAAELHCHTHHSDGTFTLKELCQAAVAEELDVIASTDHNTQSAQFELTEALQQETLPVIRGIEWTTFFGHMLVLGANDFVDWRFATPDTIDSYIAQVRQAGGLVGLAHPFDLGSPMCTGGHWDFHVKDWSQVQYIEIWHEDFPSLKTPNLRALAFWTQLLDRGAHITPVYGKDWHGPWQPEMQGACTYLGMSEQKVTPEAACKSLANGRTVVTLGPKFTMYLTRKEKQFEIGDTLCAGKATVHFKLDMDARSHRWKRFGLQPATVRLIGNGGELLAQLPCNGTDTATTELTLDKGWLRGELWGTSQGEECALAITGAVYIV